MADSVNLELDTIRILIGQIRNGDQAAQSDLINQIESYVMMMSDKNLDHDVRACVGASDIAQQTMIKMVDGIDKFRGDSTPEFFGWVNKIIQNEALKSRRDLTRQKRDIRRRSSLEALQDDSQIGFEPSESLVTPQANALARERVEIFHAALARMSEEYATVIRLRNLEDLSFSEIAEKMGRTKDAVSNLWYRAVLKFKKELGALDDETRQ